jgi:hypothetical protein
MSTKIKVRFNLGKGKNYMKWKVEYPDGFVDYYNPIETQLILKNCQLKNNRKTAEKILNGEHKTVCAWVLCEDIELKYDNFTPFQNMDLKLLKYNPKVLPYWVVDDLCMDNSKIDEIGSIHNKLFLTK